jgi:hypothetical protein
MRRRVREIGQSLQLAESKTPRPGGGTLIVWMFPGFPAAKHLKKRSAKLSAMSHRAPHSHGSNSFRLQGERPIRVEMFFGGCNPVGRDVALGRRQVDLSRAYHWRRLRDGPSRSGGTGIDLFACMKAALQDSPMCQPTLPQSPGPTPSGRAISGSRGAALARDCARLERSSHAGFFGIGVAADGGRDRGTLPRQSLPHHARVCPTRAHSARQDCENAQRAL